MPWLTPLGLIVLGLGLAALELRAGGVGPTSCLTMCGTPLLVFAGVALGLQQWREVREAGYASNLPDAARFDTLVLHRISIAVPARHRQDLPRVDGGDTGRAHRLLEALEERAGDAIGVAYEVDPVEVAADRVAALDNAVRALRDRAYAETRGSYRDGARESLARPGQEGFVVLTVLLLAYPTDKPVPSPLTLADVSGLRDVILPVAPRHTLGARIVVTPEEAATSLDGPTVHRCFPELRGA